LATPAVYLNYLRANRFNIIERTILIIIQVTTGKKKVKLPFLIIMSPGRRKLPRPSFEARKKITPIIVIIKPKPIITLAIVSMGFI
jgi:hypothetical protein